MSSQTTGARRDRLRVACRTVRHKCTPTVIGHRPALPTLLVPRATHIRVGAVYTLRVPIFTAF
jgi:hypothetical protein